MDLTDRLIKHPAKRVLHRLARASGVVAQLEELQRQVRAPQGVQALLALRYRDLVATGQQLPPLHDVEFQVNSQNGEDGILLYLATVLGAPTRRAAEVCAGTGIECNIANLILNHGWRGLLVDGNPHNIEIAREYYTTSQQSAWYPPTIAQAWVTAENINDLIRSHGFAGDIDLLSLDLDGVDYWIWKALDAARPRVVVTEFNWTWGPHESMTVPYDSAFTIPSHAWAPDGRHRYFGASLAALTNLAADKGYRLIGTQRWGFNAFFVENGLGDELLPAVSPESCYESPSLRMRWKPDFLDQLRTFEWERV